MLDRLLQFHKTLSEEIMITDLFLLIFTRLMPTVSWRNLPQLNFFNQPPIDFETVFWINFWSSWMLRRLFRIGKLTSIASASLRSFLPASMDVSTFSCACPEFNYSSGIRLPTRSISTTTRRNCSIFRWCNFDIFFKVEWRNWSKVSGPAAMVTRTSYQPTCPSLKNPSLM